MTAPLVSIIIVNWNGKQYLPDCLDSLLDQYLKDFETIVVDNGSNDGSLELLQHSYSWVRVVSLATNTGFASGNNAGFAVSRGKYIVTLNNDTRVERDWLVELTAPVEARPEIGMVASRICSWDTPDQIDSLGVTVCRDGMSRGSRRLALFSTLTLAKTEDILLPSACAALYRRKMIDETGFFDDDFFAYCEDTDLGLRGRMAGWQALLARDAVVYHRYSRSGGVFSPFKLYLVERNHFWVALKNFPLTMLMVLPFWTIVRYFVQAQLVLAASGVGADFRSGSQKDLSSAVSKGIIDMIRGLPVIIRKRRAASSMRRLSSGEAKALLCRYEISFRELLDAG